MRWTQKWEFPFLGNFQIVDDSPKRADFGAGEAAEGVQRGRVEQARHPFFRRRAVERTTCHRGQWNTHIRDYFT